jgi:hypothetical protein
VCGTCVMYEDEKCGTIVVDVACRTKGFHFQNVNKWCGEWNKPHLRCRTLGSCLIMWSMLLAGQLWFVMCTILFIVKWWPLWFVTCSLRTLKFNKSCGQNLMKPCSNTSFQNWISKDSWLIMHKPIGMISKLFMVLGTLMSRWLIKNTHVYSIGLSRSIGTSKNWSNLGCKINTMLYAINIRIQSPLWKFMVFILQFVVGGCH